jgi:hypothetical protein
VPAGAPRCGGPAIPGLTHRVGSTILHNYPSSPHAGNTRIWLPSVSRRGWQRGSRLAIGGSGEVTCPKSWCGDASRPRLNQRRFPGVLPGPSPRRRRGRRAWSCSEVGEPALQAAHGLVGGLPGSDFAVVVGAARGGVAQRDHGHHARCLAGLAVPAAGEPVPDVVSGGGVDGGRSRSRTRSGPWWGSG